MLNSKFGSPNDVALFLELDFKFLSVSYLSSLLRALQAVLREVARTENRVRVQFEESTPILVVCGLESGAELTLSLVFSRPDGAEQLTQISTTVFASFLSQFGEFLHKLPQPGLWGKAALSRPQPNDSELSKRFDQIYRELQRSSKSAIRFQDRVIQIEGSYIEIV